MEPQAWTDSLERHKKWKNMGWVFDCDSACRLTLLLFLYWWQKMLDNFCHFQRYAKKKEREKSS